jgi:pimeloyl-ACP methyl ester carboxylesterase
MSLLYIRTGCTGIVHCAVLVALLGMSTSAVSQSVDCDPPPEPTITVHLPLVGLPPDDEGQGWDRPPVWEHLPGATDDSITIPNGRPIYALFIGGFGSNKYFDELLAYNFARHLQAQGAYVHYSWWNNLLAPYLERPLHHNQSHPGGTSIWNMPNFATSAGAAQKAAPGEDYQFQADAKLLLSAIRANNPSAMIIIVGHSMGGGSAINLAAQADVVIDIVAPIDPGNNRNYPWSGLAPLEPDFNWTRWRATRHNFLGYRSLENVGSIFFPVCSPTGPWLKSVSELSNDPLCFDLVNVDPAQSINFGPNIINLFHRWQNEFLFPFDYHENYFFGHSFPLGGTSSQASVPMLGFNEPDPGGWPWEASVSSDDCCPPSGVGIGWGDDGHGEIVGYRGGLVFGGPVPLGTRVRTSPHCGSNCSNLTWPARTESSDGVWSNGNFALRVNLLKDLENLPLGALWPHRPTNPSLCMVSPGLISLFNTMNKPPTANAGGDQFVECDGSHAAIVTLDGSASFDPDNDTLQYTWTWESFDTFPEDDIPGGSATGEIVDVVLPMGTHCVTLEVRDPSGHIDRDVVTIVVADTTPPELFVDLSPRLLWPPNHKMVDIHAVVEAYDLCGEVVELELVSIVSNQPENDYGDGNTAPDIIANVGTLDTPFQLRAERAGPGGDRIYTVTYQATDDSGNRAEVAVDVIVPHNAQSYQKWLQALSQK